MEVAHIDAWRRDPERFWSFYGQRFQTLGGKRPNGAHAALVELESRGLLDAVITQNIDMLHRTAGTRELVEVHGSIASSSCLACGASYPLDEVVARLAGGDVVPACDCGRPLKPDVVLFGEVLPAAALERAAELAARRRPAALRRLVARGLSGLEPARAHAASRGRRRDRHAGVRRGGTAARRSSSTATSRTSCARSSRAI